jgi:hypothetical protein
LEGSVLRSGQQLRINGVAGLGRASTAGEHIARLALNTKDEVWERTANPSMMARLRMISSVIAGRILAQVGQRQNRDGHWRTLVPHPPPADGRHSDRKGSKATAEPKATRTGVCPFQLQRIGETPEYSHPSVAR